MLPKKGLKKEVFSEKFFLTSSPFRVADMYNPDNPGTYVREMYGEQLVEFHRKFLVNPLERDEPQTIGGVWSSHTKDSEGRGFGKSMLMCEEARIVNQDFGASILTAFDVTDEAVAGNPFIAGYCSFDQSKDVQTFPAALLGVLGSLCGATMMRVPMFVVNCGVALLIALARKRDTRTRQSNAR